MTGDNESIKNADDGGNSGPPPKNASTPRNPKTGNKQIDPLLLDIILDRPVPLVSPTLPPKKDKPGKNAPK